MAEIWLYTADRWGVDQADAYIRQIENDIGRAVKFPEMGSPATYLSAEYRKLKSGSHRVIYRHTDAELIVMRVLHERQDVPDEIKDL